MFSEFLNRRTRDTRPPSELAFARTLIEFIKNDDSSFIVVVRCQISFWSYVETEWRPLYGGHCSIDAVSLADFLVR